MFWGLERVHETAMGWHVSLRQHITHRAVPGGVGSSHFHGVCLPVSCGQQPAYRGWGLLADHPSASTGVGGAGGRSKDGCEADRRSPRVSVRCGVVVFRCLLVVPWSRWVGGIVLVLERRGMSLLLVFLRQIHNSFARKQSRGQGSCLFDDKYKFRHHWSRNIPFLCTVLSNSLILNVDACTQKDVVGISS